MLLQLLLWKAAFVQDSSQVCQNQAFADDKGQCRAKVGEATEPVRKEELLLAHRQTDGSFEE